MLIKVKRGAAGRRATLTLPPCDKIKSSWATQQLGAQTFQLYAPSRRRQQTEVVIPPGPFGFFRGVTYKAPKRLGLYIQNPYWAGDDFYAALDDAVVSAAIREVGYVDAAGVLWGPQGEVHAFSSEPTRVAAILHAAVLGPIPTDRHFHLVETGLEPNRYQRPLGVYRIANRIGSSIGEGFGRKANLFGCNVHNWQWLQEATKNGSAERIEMREWGSRSWTLLAGTALTMERAQTVPGSFVDQYFKAVEWFRQQWGGHVCG